MKKSTFNTLLVGGGFLLGTAGIKLAKANVDDMVAEAAYITQSEAAADEAAE